MCYNRIGDCVRILGIDPGLQVTGYGLIEHQEGHSRLVEGGVVRSDAKAELEVRLRQIHQGVGEVLAELQPDVIVVEGLYSKYRHPRTAILMGHARGVIYLAAAERGIPICTYPASLVKRAVSGYGRASKAQVSAMVCQLLRLEAPPEPADVTDALALALCHTSALRGEINADRKLPPIIQEALASEGEQRR